MSDSPRTRTKLLVSGSRDWDNWASIEAELARVYSAYGSNVTLIHGDARGADRMCGHVAQKKGWAVEPHPADWDGKGRKAGLVRNVEMLDRDPDLIIAFRKDNSRGTTHLINTAREAGYTVKVIEEATAPPLTNSSKENEMAELNAEQMAQVIASALAAVMTAQGTTEVPKQLSTTDATFDNNVKDQSGKPLKLSGHGVAEVKGMAKNGCRDCGTGNVAWVLSNKTYSEGHPKAGQQVPYLAQAYPVEGRIIALKFEPHFQFCKGGGTTPTPVSTQESETSASVEEGDKVESIDDQLEAPRAATGTFDSFVHAEVDEVASDVGMGFLFYSDLNDMAEDEEKRLSTD